MFDADTVIDLSNPLANDAPAWPTLPAFESTQTARAARDGATTRRARFGYLPVNYQDTSGASVRAFAVV